MIRIFSDYETLSTAAAEYLVTVGKQAVALRGKFDLVLSGGRTPELTYRNLASRFGHERKLWERTRVFWSDERCVPPDSPQSNYRLARTAFLDCVSIPPGQIHRIAGENPDPERAAEVYEKVFPLSSDLLLLGMGADGHTASLFPGSPVLDDMQYRIRAVKAPVEPSGRITITPRVIANALEVLVLVSGEDKSEAIIRVFSETEDMHITPAVLVRKALWFADHAAGGKTTKTIIKKEED